LFAGSRPASINNSSPASFQELLATLHSESQQQYLSQLSLPAPVSQKLKQTIQALALLNI
tara:strand:+ start:14604 stop:14783 length:180 start_codon:yes stop_codon:yes gene_type:complete